MFDRYARLDPSRDRSTGNAGLGLAIASDVAARHGGSIVAEDAIIGGARFVVTLPAAAT